VNLEYVKQALAGKIRPHAKPDGTAKLASVLVVVYGKNPCIIMTEKDKNLRIHAGEISFPGGKYEQQDANLLDTALRETREEIGLDVDQNSVLGQLDCAKTLNTNFQITPFVAVLNDIPTLSASGEVHNILRIPLEPFLGTMSYDDNPEYTAMGEMYRFQYRGKIVWGASARILHQIALLLK